MPSSHKFSHASYNIPTTQLWYPLPAGEAKPQRISVTCTGSHDLCSSEGGQLSPPHQSFTSPASIFESGENQGVLNLS